MPAGSIGRAGIADARLADIAGELALKPGHEKVKASIQELLVDGLGAEAEKVSAAVELAETMHFATARRRVGEALADSGASQRIDALVARLLLD